MRIYAPRCMGRDVVIEQGKFNGYVPAGRRMYVMRLDHSMAFHSFPFSIDTESGLRDRVEIYNIPSALLLNIACVVPSFNRCVLEFNGDFPQVHPPVVEENIKEVEQFARVSIPPANTIDGTHQVV